MAKKRPKLGTGKRFASLRAKLTKKGAASPAALAAWIGKRKYGQKKMTKKATAGKKRKK